MAVYETLKRFCPKFVLNVLAYIKHPYLRKYYHDKHKYRERCISKGKDYPDLTFFLIRRISEVEGHCSILNSFLGHLYQADRDGYVPVIDMKNYFSGLWQAADNKYVENAWEYFYEQPAGYNLDSIEHAKNIRLCFGVDSEYRPSLRTIFWDKERLVELKRIYDKYIHLNSFSQKYIDSCKNKIHITENTLGVSIRRGIEWGYIVDLPSYKTYDKPQSFAETIEVIERKKKEWNCDKIFLSIDDESSIQDFKDVFGAENILYMDRSRPVYFNHGTPISIEEYNASSKKRYGNTQKEITERELAFLAEVHLLASCACVIMEKTSANVTASIINGGRYRNQLILD